MNLAVESIEFGWRLSLGLQVILGFILIVGMLFLPETPRSVYTIAHHVNYLVQ